MEHERGSILQPLLKEYKQALNWMSTISFSVSINIRKPKDYKPSISLPPMSYNLQANHTKPLYKKLCGNVSWMHMDEMFATRLYGVYML